MTIVGVEPPELPPALVAFALPPMRLLELFAFDPHAAATSAVITTRSTTANGRRSLPKRNAPRKRRCPKPRSVINSSARYQLELPEGASGDAQDGLAGHAPVHQRLDRLAGLIPRP